MCRHKIELLLPKLGGCRERVVSKNVFLQMWAGMLEHPCRHACMMIMHVHIPDWCRARAH